MPRSLPPPALLALTAALLVAAAPWPALARTVAALPPRPAPAAPAPRPAGDPEAIRESSGPAGAGQGVSAQALGHYLAARRAAGDGQFAAAAEELRLAVYFDDDSAELRAAHASALALSGRIEASEAEARKAIELDPEGRPATLAHVLMARILAARNEPARSLSALRAAMAVEAGRAAAGETGDVEPWRMAADQQLQDGDAEGALATLEEAVARVASDGGGFREAGRALLERKDAARAERALRRAVNLSRFDGEAWRLLADAHEALHRRREAREDLLAILRLEPEDPDAQLGLGRLAMLEDDEAAAREWFARLLGGPAGGWEAHLRVAFEWLDGHRPEEALAVARRGLALPESNPRLRLVEGLALQARQRWEAAATALEQVPPEAGDAWRAARVALSRSRSRMGWHEAALAALEPAISARPGDPGLVAARAEALVRAGRAGQAVEALQAALDGAERAGEVAALDELFPALAEVLLRAGRADEAVALLRRGAAARPGDAVLRYALAATLERAGQGEAALAEMRALLAAEPDHAEALNFVGFTWAEQGVRLEEAEGMVRRALDLAPRSGHIIDSLGWLRFKRGDPRQAVELLEQADRLVGPDPAVLDHLGDAYRAAGRPADAQAAWRRALTAIGEELPAEQLALRAALTAKLEALKAASERKATAR